jgi:hypothetical protein
MAPKMKAAVGRTSTIKGMSSAAGCLTTCVYVPEEVRPQRPVRWCSQPRLLSRRGRPSCGPSLDDHELRHRCGMAKEAGLMAAWWSPALRPRRTARMAMRSRGTWRIPGWETRRRHRRSSRRPPRWRPRSRTRPPRRCRGVLSAAGRRPDRRRRGLQRQAARVGGLLQLPSPARRPRRPDPLRTAQAEDDPGVIDHRQSHSQSAGSMPVPAPAHR